MQSEQLFKKRGGIALKKEIKFGLGLFLVMVFGIVSGNPTVAASANDAGAKYDDKIVTIQSLLDPWWVVDYDTETFEVSTHLNQGIDSQKWLMSYNEQEDAYTIRCRQDRIIIVGDEQFKNPLYLTVSSAEDEKGNEVIGVEPEYPNERRFWRLVEDDVHMDGEVYYLENLYNGDVMDAPGLNLGKEHQLITFPKNGEDNQKWIIQVEGTVAQN